MRRRTRAAGWLLLAGLLVSALYLHFRDVSAQLIGDDEIHAVRKASELSFAEILTTYSDSDNSIPLTLWAKALMETVGLDELRLRAPILLADLLLLLSPLLFRRRLGWPVCLSAMALFATSPLIVYYSIVARPYTPAALATVLATFAWHRWMDRRNTRRCVVFAGCCALAVFLHLFCIFPVVALFAVTALELPSGRTQSKELAAALGLTLLLILLPLGPGLPGLLETRLTKIGSDVPVPTALSTSWKLLTGHLRTLAYALPVLMALGARSLFRADARLGRAAVTLVLLQLLAVCVLRPHGTPDTWARYLYLVWPIALLLVAGGLEELVRGLLRRRRRDEPLDRVQSTTVILAGLLLAAWTPLASPMWLFRAGRTSFRSGQTMLLKAPNPARRSGVYRALRRDPNAGSVLIQFPGATASSKWRKYVERGMPPMHVKLLSVGGARRGLDYRNVVDLLDAEELLQSGARYVVVRIGPFSDAVRRRLAKRYGPPVVVDHLDELYELPSPSR